MKEYIKKTICFKKKSICFLMGKEVKLLSSILICLCLKTHFRIQVRSIRGGKTLVSLDPAFSLDTATCLLLTPNFRRAGIPSLGFLSQDKGWTVFISLCALGHDATEGARPLSKFGNLKMSLGSFPYLLNREAIPEGQMPQRSLRQRHPFK